MQPSQESTGTVKKTNLRGDSGHTFSHPIPPPWVQQQSRPHDVRGCGVATARGVDALKGFKTSGEVTRDTMSECSGEAAFNAFKASGEVTYDTMTECSWEAVDAVDS